LGSGVLRQFLLPAVCASTVVAFLAMAGSSSAKVPVPTLDTEPIPVVRPQFLIPQTRFIGAPV